MGRGGSDRGRRGHVGGTSGGGGADGIVLALRVATASSDGVIYASKEHPSGNGPILVLTFAVTVVTTTTANANDSSSEALKNETKVDEAALSFSTVEVQEANVKDILDTIPPSTREPTMSPEPIEQAVMMRPFKPGQAGLLGDKTPKENVSSSTQGAATSNATSSNEGEVAIKVSQELRAKTSVVSSSFRMTVAARRTSYDPWRHRRDLKNGEEYYAHYPPTIEEKERPAVVSHLAEVYGRVLSIAPATIEAVFEEDLETEEMSMNPNSSDGEGGVVRRSVFRVVGELYIVRLQHVWAGGRYGCPAA